MEACLERLAAGGTIVTANKRLARSIREADARRQELAGRSAWPTPDALPWNAWLARLWHTAARAEPLPALLGEALEQELWRAAIGGDSQSSGLLDIDEAARAAREARARLAGWQVPAEALQRFASDETAALLRWSSRVERRCSREGWLEPARLPGELMARLPELGRALPAHCVLAGFDELTPRQSAFLVALARRGTRVETLEAADRNRRVRRVELADTRSELEAAARWARAIAARDSGARIGVVVPALIPLREDAQRIFTAVLCPQAAARHSMQERLPFSISAGRPLADYPLVDAALRILDGARRALSPDVLGALLCSPWIGGAQAEASRRALLEARLRELRPAPDFARIGREASLPDTPHACPELARRLLAIAAQAAGFAGARPPGDWPAAFDAVLTAAGWPGDRTLSSHEYQTVEAFRSVERELFALGAVTGSVNWEPALALLGRLASASMFQPETPAAAIEILGTLEAAGQTFDHLWMVGLHDEIWPAAPSPNGFLPVALQREFEMPHASPERELEFAKTVTRRLVESAFDVVVSSPRVDADRRLRPSPLIRAYEAADVTLLDLDGESLPADRVFAARGCERLAFDPAPVLGGTETARGGTQLLKHQSACPFRAFAEHRLRADALETPASGIDPRERGNLLHDAMRRIWTELRDQPGLLRLGGAERQALVARAVAAAARRLSPPHASRLVSLEAERAERLVGRLLDVEAARAPFAVEGCEVRAQVAVGGIEVATCVDRIDRLAGGETLIVDYKTGRSNLRDLTGERPNEPQLPLYATLGRAHPAAGVAYAALRNDQAGFVGVARDAGVAPGIVGLDAWRDRPLEATDWNALLARWRVTLERLARDFAAGRAEVDPKYGSRTCRYCHLAVLCRIDELRAGARED